MAEDNTEIPLAGGNINEQVVRVGDTVRRAQTPRSSTVHRLLKHLENHSFSATPRYLGIDDKNREILSFLPGETEFPKTMWTKTDALVASGKLLRKLHDVTADFKKSDDDCWAVVHPDPTKHEVICHNDFAPYNMVFNQGIPTGIYDFDLAGPGPRLRDIAYLAYWMVPLSFSSDDLTEHSVRDLENGSARLKLLCETYGIPANSALLNMVERVMNQMADRNLVLRTVGEEALKRLEDLNHFKHWENEAAKMVENRTDLTANLD